MSENSHLGNPTDGISRTDQIADLVAQYRGEWEKVRDGQPAPKMASYLVKCPAEVRTSLREQLEQVDQQHRAGGQGPKVSDAACTNEGAANILEKNPKATPDELAEWVFLRALSRKPTNGELTAAKALLGEKPTAESVADLLWAVVMLPEFQLVR